MKSLAKETNNTFQNVRLGYIGAYGISLFFGLLFYVTLTHDSTGATGGFDITLFKYLVSISSITAALLIMEIYNMSPRVLYIKYAFVVALIVMIGLSINELTKGADEALDGTGGDKDIEWTYASLSVGFAGVGAVIAFVHHLNTHSSVV